MKKKNERPVIRDGVETAILAAAGCCVLCAILAALTLSGTIGEQLAKTLLPVAIFLSSAVTSGVIGKRRGSGALTVALIAAGVLLVVMTLLSVCLMKSAWTRGSYPACASACAAGMAAGALLPALAVGKRHRRR